MWTIRQDQAEAFRQHHLKKFEDEMVEHLQKFCPRYWSVMGEADGRRVIQLGIERARKYGFTNRGPVRFYIELMLLFGSDFDTDPQHLWASKVLNDPENLDPAVRAHRLFNAMEKYASRVFGQDQTFLIAALQRLSGFRFERFQDAVSAQRQLLRQMEMLYPQKYEYIGEPVAMRLIQHGFHIAERWGCGTHGGKLLMASFTLSLGHGFPHDPQYSWMNRVLNTAAASPDDRIKELASRWMLYVNRIVAGSKQNE